MFEPVVVTGTAAHPVKFLRNNGVIGLRQCKPIQWLVTVVTRGRSNSQPDEVSITSELRHFRQIANDYIGPRKPMSARLLRLRARNGGMTTDLVSPLTRV